MKCTLSFLFIAAISQMIWLHAQPTFDDCSTRLEEIHEQRRASYPQAIQSLDSLLQSCEEAIGARDSALLALAYHRKGVYLYLIGNYESAIQANEEALAIRRQLRPSSPNLVGHSHINIARCHQRLAQTIDQQFHLTAATHLLETSQDDKRKGQANFDLATSLWENNDYSAATDYVHKALSAYTKAQSETDIANCKLFLGTLYLDQNQLEEANTFLREAQLAYTPLSLERLSALLALAKCWNNLGQLAHKEGRWATAIENYLIADSICRSPDLLGQASSQEILGDVHNAIGLTYTQLGELKRAQEAFETSEAVFLDIYPAEDYIFAMISDNRGDISALEGKHQEALAHYQGAISQAIAEFDPQDDLSSPRITDSTKILDLKANLLTYLRSKAKTLQRMTQSTEASDPYLQAALDIYKQADKLIFRMRKEHLNDGSKLFWIEQSRPLYEEAIRLCHRVGDIQQAYEFAEKSMASLLLAEINNLAAKSLADISEEMLRKERKLKERVRSYEIRLDQAHMEEASPADIAQLTQILSQARISLQDFIQDLEQQSPAYYAQKYQSKVASIKAVQLYLKTQPERSAFLQYFSGDSALYLFCILPDTAYFWEMEQPYAAAQSFFRVISDTANITQEFNRLSLNVVSYEMYRALLEPIRKAELSLPERLTIIADGYLAKVPFEALITDPNEDPNSPIAFFLRKHICRYASSASTLLNSYDRPSSKQKDVLAVAPVRFQDYQALPFSQLEVQKILRSMNGRALLDSNASKSNVLEQISKYRILHFSTHAVAHSGTPFIVFADTLLFLPEIYSLHTNADMIVLSACETLQGDQIKGEGFMSLARAFQYIGVPSLTATLWSVSDQSTQEIMNLYYKQLAAGISKDEALQQAKLQYLDAQETFAQAPFFWAPLVLVGDASALPSRDASKLWLAVFGFLLICVLGLGLWHMRKRRSKMGDMSAGS